MAALKYPIGMQTFEQLRAGGFVYVDKTDMIYSLATEGKTYFLSRPRRFGKSLLLSTIESYFLGRKELFQGLKIADLEQRWDAYPVLHIDFGAGDFASGQTLEELLHYKLSAWEDDCHIDHSLTDLSLRFCRVIEQTHKRTGKRVVVLVDEYDKPLLDVMETPLEAERSGRPTTLEDRNRGILKSLYAAFKVADADLRFVFLTGVTKFSQVSVFSGFNQPKDISMVAAYDTICGVTEEELETYFHDRIDEIARAEGCAYEQMKLRLRRQYDGYHFSKRLTGVYNPFSLLNALQDAELRNYWFKTGTPTYLVKLLQHFDQDMDELTSEYYEEEAFADYRADTERPLPMIYQSGYLTIKDHDRETNTFRLDYPNNEVKQGFLSILANTYLRTAKSVDSWLVRGVRALKEGRMDEFRRVLTAFFASIPYSLRRRGSDQEEERDFHYTFYLVLRLLSTYLVCAEKQQSQGRVDCVVETDRYVYIFEFKRNGTAREALRQIRDRGYANEYAADSRKLFLIGCDFSSATGTLDSWEVVE